MIEVVAAIGGGATVVLAIAVALGVAYARSLSDKLDGARTAQLEAFTKQVAAENRATAAESQKLTAIDERDAALRALAVYEEGPAPTPETDHAATVATDPAVPVSRLGAELDGLLSKARR